MLARLVKELNSTALGPSKRSDGRQRLMDAAQSLFSRWGYSRVSISQILEASDLRAPSLYHHYGGKEKLFASWALQSLARVGGRLRMLPGGTPVAATTQIMSALLSDSDVNLMQLAAEMDLLEDEETRGLLSEAIEHNVVRPIQSLLESAGLRCSRDCALLVAQMAMMLRPGFSSFTPGLTLESVAEVAALGLRAADA